MSRVALAGVLTFVVLFAGCDRPLVEVPAARDNASGDSTPADTVAKGEQAPVPAPVAPAARSEVEATVEDEDGPAVQVVHPSGYVEPQEGADVPTPSPDDRWLKCEQYDAPMHGKTLRTLRIGKPGGREVLLLHGARFESRTWLDLGTLELLAKNGCRAVAIDLPGYGKSKDVTAKPEEFLHLALPYLDLKKPVIVFPSMSGTFAFPFATAHPELVAGLVPVAPVAIDDYAKKLKGLELPTLIVWGENDTVVPLAKAQVLHELLPGSTKIVIPGASHPCYQDQPQQFHAALLKFLKGLDAVKEAKKPDGG